jgi:hypothetical protein
VSSAPTGRTPGAKFSAETVYNKRNMFSLAVSSVAECKQGHREACACTMISTKSAGVIEDAIGQRNESHGTLPYAPCHVEPM